MLVACQPIHAEYHIKLFHWQNCKINQMNALLDNHNDTPHTLTNGVRGSGKSRHNQVMT